MAISYRKRNATPTPAVGQPDVDLLAWETLRSRCLPVHLARQRRLVESGVGGDWDLDLDTGRAQIGPSPTSVQLLGNADEVGGSFMFGWRVAELNGVDAALGAVARRGAAAAQASGCTLFAAETVSDVIDPADVAAVLGVLGGSAAQYRGPHGTGSVYFTLEDLPVDRPLPLEAVLTTATQALQLGLQDHRVALAALLQAEGFVLGEGGTARRGDETVTAEFDGAGRLGGLRSSLRPTT